MVTESKDMTLLCRSVFLRFWPDTVSALVIDWEFLVIYQGNRTLLLHLSTGVCFRVHDQKHVLGLFSVVVLQPLCTWLFQLNKSWDFAQLRLVTKMADCKNYHDFCYVRKSLSL